jgi:predicted ABC-type transport system involved in lysophospholipase L1 biosynthesis ATPase subunit
MLHNALNLDRVTLPGEAGVWPAPLSLAVALDEVVLIEGAGPGVSVPLADVAATLEFPAGGRVRHWGQEAARVTREELYRLRSRIAYISPEQVLLHRFTLGENIALGPCYHQGWTEGQALAAHGPLLLRLNLSAHLTRYPTQVSPAVYARAVWARELVKEPELILVVAAGELATVAGAAWLAQVLGDYQDNYGAAMVLWGGSLEPFYPLGHRLFRLEAGQLQERPLLEQRPRPLTAYLPLV